MTRQKPRSLRSDELELWRRVSKTARPLKSGKANAERYQPKDDNASTTGDQPQPFGLKSFRIGSLASSTTAPVGEGRPTSETRKRTTGNIDKSIANKLRRGKLRPEAKIDLHGLTVDKALPTLTSFLFRAHAGGKRLVLVITGKGSHPRFDNAFPSQPGILRRSLPMWVARPPLASIVQDITEAHQRHGGSGAFYVYLRRSG